MQIGSYRVLKVLGEGSLGRVFKVFHIEKEKVYALKKIHEHYQRNPSILGIFHREMMIHGKISHPNCVEFIEANLKPPHTHIVTGFVDGFPFRKFLYDIPPPPLVSCILIIELLRGLDHLHCLDIIHADLSPNNVMLDRTGRVKIVDFGLSAIQEIETHAGVSIGTPGYMAPERLLKEPVSVQTDLFTVGLILGQLLSRAALVNPQSSPKEQYGQIKQLHFRWLQFSDPYFQKRIINVLRRACSINPDQRPASARDFMREIYSAIEQYRILYLRPAIFQWLIESEIVDKPVDYDQRRKQRIHLA